MIEILLPLRGDGGEAFPASGYDRLAQLLTERFGGVTSFALAGEGRWHNEGALVALEVMANELDRAWWSELRKTLMHEFRQEDIVVSSQPIEPLT
jgi:hypothetical protein